MFVHVIGDLAGTIRGVSWRRGYMEHGGTGKFISIRRSDLYLHLLRVGGVHHFPVRVEDVLDVDGSGAPGAGSKPSRRGDTNRVARRGRRALPSRVGSRAWENRAQRAHSRRRYARGQRRRGVAVQG